MQCNACSSLCVHLGQPHCGQYNALCADCRQTVHALQAPDHAGGSRFSARGLQCRHPPPRLALCCIHGLTDCPPYGIPSSSPCLPVCLVRSVQYATGEVELLDLDEVIRDGHCSLLA